MINMALNDKDKEDYIIGVSFLELGEKLKIIYADEHVEIEDFSLLRLNEIWRKMERQFETYKDTYCKVCYERSLKAILKSLGEAILAIGAVYFTTNLDMPLILKGLIIIFIAFSSIYYQRIWSLENKISNYMINKVNIIEEFINNKDKFKIRIVNPQDGLEYDWYLLTLSGIDEITDVRTLNLIGKSLTTEVKEDEKKNTERFLSKKMGDFR